MALRISCIVFWKIIWGFLHLWLISTVLMTPATSVFMKAAHEKPYELTKTQLSLNRLFGRTVWHHLWYGTWCFDFISVPLATKSIYIRERKKRLWCRWTQTEGDVMHCCGLLHFKDVINKSSFAVSRQIKCILHLSPRRPLWVTTTEPHLWSHSVNTSCTGQILDQVRRGQVTFQQNHFYNWGLILEQFGTRFFPTSSPL